MENLLTEHLYSHTKMSYEMEKYEKKSFIIIKNCTIQILFTLGMLS